MLRGGKWEEVNVRLCESGSPQSTTAKRGHFVGHHGEGVTQGVPPNLAAELGRRWMFACVDRGPRKVPQRSEDTLWGIMAKASRKACRRTCAHRGIARKGKIILQTIYHAISRHLRARFACLDLLPPSKNPAKRLGYCLVGGGGFEPPKSSTTDLQSAPFGHSGILPRGAGERNRTINLLITNQLLCLLSYTSISGAPA